MNTIQLINVTKTYKNGVTALHDVSLTLKEGDFISVMGQSGSGKSTLLQIAGLLDICTSGNVIINNEDVSMVAKNKLADIRLKSLGFVFQAFNLNSHLKVYENIMVPMLINPDFKDKAQMKKKAEELTERLGLSHRINHYPSELSGGEQQRVAIARAMANEPDFILADEPTGALDSKTGHMVMDIFHKLHKEQGKTIILITHSRELAEETERIITISDGMILEGGAS